MPDVVFVYFNLTRRLFSVRGNATGRVVRHASSVWLGRSTFRVLESGRRRVLREKQRNVHAGVVGDLVGWDLEDEPFVGAHGRVRYNPYEADHFMLSDDRRPVYAVEEAYLFVEDTKPVVLVRHPSFSKDAATGHHAGPARIPAAFDDAPASLAI
jgi:hypothetical protein